MDCSSAMGHVGHPSLLSISTQAFGVFICTITEPRSRPEPRPESPAEHKQTHSLVWRSECPQQHHLPGLESLPGDPVSLVHLLSTLSIDPLPFASETCLVVNLSLESMRSAKGK